MNYKILTIVLTTLMITLISNTSEAQRYWNTAAKLGGTKYIAVTPGSTLASLSSDYTLECWFNSPTSTSSTLFGKNGFRIMLETTGGQYLRVRLQINGQTQAYSSYSRKMLPNTWNHLIVKYDSSDSQATFYINGIYDTSDATVSDPIAGTDSLIIGRSNFATGDVIIDDIRIWNRDIDINALNKIYLTTYMGDSPRNNLVFCANFDKPESGPFSSLHSSGQGGTFYNRGGEPYNLGSNPSVTGAINTALKLDGIRGYARMEPHPDIEFTGAMTVEFWVNPDTIGQNFHYIVSKRSSSAGWGIYYDSGSVKVTMNNTTAHFSNSVPPRKWTHVAVTKPSGTGAKVYINGRLELTNSSLPAPLLVSDSLLIGKNSTGSNHFKGYVDGVKLTNYEKTSDEIKRSLYEVTDNSNAPSAPFKTVCMNFDFYSQDSVYRAFNGDYYELMPGATITRPYISSGVPVSPMLGANIPNFPEGYTIKYSGNRIPESNTAGFMRTDSIYVSNNTTIADINLFLLIEHSAQHSLEIYLHSPSGDSLQVWNRNYGLETRDHIMTVFDDQADSTLVNGKYLEFGPRIKLNNSINSRFSGENANGYWKLKITDYDNSGFGWLYGWGVQVNQQVLVGVENNNSAQIPGEYKLEQNYPNPFNPVTQINYKLSNSNNVKLKVYDINGKLVNMLVNQKQPAGNYSITFDGTGLASGVYFYKLETEAFTDVKKMLLVK